MGDQVLALGGCVLMDDVSDLLGAVVGDFDTDMRLICHEGLTESFLLTWGERARARRTSEAGLGRAYRLCVRGVRSCLAGRDDVLHRERRRRA